MAVDINLTGLMQLLLQQQANTVGPNIDYSKPYTGMAPAGMYPAPVGKRYRGEFPGWSYDPFYDKYFPNQQTKTGYENANNETLKGPTLGSQIGLGLLGGGIKAIPSLIGGSTGKGLASLFDNILGGSGGAASIGGALGSSTIDALSNSGLTSGATDIANAGLSSVGPTIANAVSDGGSSILSGFGSLLGDL